MPTRSELLDALSRDELIALADRLELVLPDRRSRTKALDVLAAAPPSAKALSAALQSLARDRLKELCRNLGLDEGGREKTLLVDRLLGGDAKRQPKTLPKAPRRT